MHSQEIILLLQVSFLAEVTSGSGSQRLTARRALKGVSYAAAAIVSWDAGAFLKRLASSGPVIVDRAIG